MIFGKKGEKTAFKSQLLEECTFFDLRVVFRAPWGLFRGVKSICILFEKYQKVTFSKAFSHTNLKSQ